jgi:hypothetical protein
MERKGKKETKSRRDTLRGTELKWRKAIKCRAKLMTLPTPFKCSLKVKHHVSLNYSSYVMVLRCVDDSRMTRTVLSKTEYQPETPNRAAAVNKS